MSFKTNLSVAALIKPDRPVPVVIPETDQSLDLFYPKRMLLKAILKLLVFIGHAE